jgi:hypothetical protein
MYKKRMLMNDIKQLLSLKFVLRVIIIQKQRK